MNPSSSAPLRFGQRTKITGDAGFDLKSLDTFPLPDGCVALVDLAPMIPDVGGLRALASAALKERGPCDKTGEPCLLGELKVGSTVHLRMQGRLMPAVVTSLNPFAARFV